MKTIVFFHRKLEIVGAEEKLKYFWPFPQIYVLLLFLILFDSVFRFHFSWCPKLSDLFVF